MFHHLLPPAGFTMASSLNPQAPEYLPLSNGTSLTPWMNSNLHPMLPTTPSFIQPAFPTSPVPFPYSNQPPLHVPEYLLTFHQSQSLYSLTFLPQYSTNCLPLLPSPEQTDVLPHPASLVPPPPARVSSLVVKSEPTELVLLPRVVTTEKNGVARCRMLKTDRGRGRGKEGFRGNSEWVRRGVSSLDEEKRADRGRIYIEKYQSLTLRRDEDKTTVMIKNIPYQYTYAVDFLSPLLPSCYE